MRLSFLLSTLLISLAAGPALAQAAECADLTTLQRLAGYVTLLGLIKVLGATVIAVGILFVAGGVIARVIFQSKVLLEILGYGVSLALIGRGYFEPDSANLTWIVFTGCILFGGSVMATLWIHNIKGDDPKTLAAFFAVVWGSVAIFYNLTEVGFLAVMALVTVLGFSFWVGQLSYAFGYERKRDIAPATMAALILLAGFVGIHALMPDAPTAVTVFKPGMFWVGSFVAFIGLLIMSSRWGASSGNYLVMQIITIVILGAAVTIGLVLAINPLAGMAGTFLVFYLAAKPIEVKARGHIAFGLMLMASGGILYTAWWYGTKYTNLVADYLTTQF